MQQFKASLKRESVTEVGVYLKLELNDSPNKFVEGAGRYLSSCQFPIGVLKGQSIQISSNDVTFPPEFDIYNVTVNPIKETSDVGEEGTTPIDYLSVNLSPTFQESSTREFIITPNIPFKFFTINFNGPVPEGLEIISVAWRFDPNMGNVQCQLDIQDNDAQEYTRAFNWDDENSKEINDGNDEFFSFPGESVVGQRGKGHSDFGGFTPASYEAYVSLV